MQLFIDSADVAELRAAAASTLIDGVTTNPSLIAKSGRNMKEAIAEICAIIPGPVSAEAVATDVEGMLAEGRKVLVMPFCDVLTKSVVARIADWQKKKNDEFQLKLDEEKKRLQESLETTRIYSSYGLLKHGESLLKTRPFRAPHHTISDAGMVCSRQNCATGASMLWASIRVRTSSPRRRRVASMRGSWTVRLCVSVRNSMPSSPTLLCTG